MNDSAYIDIKCKKGDFLLRAKTFIPNGIVGVFGPSGSGKSTLLKLLAGIENPNEGQIIVRGKEFFNKGCKIKVPVRKRKVGLVFQEGRLFPHMTIYKNLLFGYTSGSSISIEDVIELLEIEHLLNKKPDECSGGEKQRVAIGRMLLSSPSILMLDEPFSALDQRLRRNIIPYLLKINEKFDLPILVVSHDLADLLMLTDKLMVIDNGAVRGIGLYNDLFFKPGTKEILQLEDPLNVVRVEAQSVDCQKDVLSFYYESNFPSNYLLIDGCAQVFPNDQIIMSISPRNISLSLERIKGISARNQLVGKIISVFEEKNRAYCKVDVGFPLLVEITHQALLSMSLKDGMAVCCMFKTSSMKILFVGK